MVCKRGGCAIRDQVHLQLERKGLWQWKQAYAGWSESFDACLNDGEPKTARNQIECYRRASSFVAKLRLKACLPASGKHLGVALGRNFLRRKYELLAMQGHRGSRCCRHKLVACRDHKKVWFLEDRATCQVTWTRRPMGESSIEFALANCGELISRSRYLKPKIDIGAMTLQCQQTLSKYSGMDGALDVADCQGPGDAFGLVGRPRLKTMCRRQNSLALLEKPAPGGVELQALSAAHEQSEPESVFQRDDLAAQRRLRDVQAISRARDALQFGDCHKVVQLLQIKHKTFLVCYEAETDVDEHIRRTDDRDHRTSNGAKFMSLTRFGFIVTGAGLDPSRDRSVMSSAGFQMIAVGVPTALAGVEVARALVAEGVQLIELCGGFGPVGTAAVLEAVGGAVPVGSVGYGPESIAALAQLFST